MKLRIAASAVAALGWGAFDAQAGSITQPGETAGLALGAPLPEGVYFLNTGSVGGFRAVGNDATLGVNIPVLAWSTPWQVAGGRIEAYAAAPFVSYSLPDDTDHFDLYNPFFTAGIAWDLGGNWGFSTFVGAYGPVDNDLGQNMWVFNSRSALSYTGDNWNLTAHVIVGLTGEDENTGVRTHPDYVNLDLTAVKAIDKWQVGLVGFGSWDTSGTFYTDRKQSQFALGGLVGYDFGKFTLQSYVTHDVWTKNYETEETRGWLRLILPVWSAPKAEPVTYKR
jgi:hypothetical protein